jgi:hypothetical protein
MMLIKNLKREEALMSGGCVALAHKQHLTKTPFFETAGAFAEP